MNLKRVLAVNGANMDLLGKRDENVLGTDTLESVMMDLAEYGRTVGAEIICYQSNAEGEIINLLHKAGKQYDAIIINLGSFGHYSIGIKEALEAATIPCVEVHLANFFRKPENKSVLAPVCRGLVCGFGRESYQTALDGIMKMLK